jgi:hypothetical protein
MLNDKFVTGVGMGALIHAKVTCLSVRMEKNIIAKYSLPIVFICHCLNDLLLCFILTVVRHVRC